MVYIPKRSVSHILIFKKGRENMLTTLCYLEKDNKYLMLHRNKKEIDINKGKWLGVGGKLENGETPEECLRREVREETGYELRNFKFRGIVTFIFEKFGKEIAEYMHLFSAKNVAGEPIECNEGVFEWVYKNKVYDLSLWEGDKIFLKLLENRSDFFSLKLVYDSDEKLIEVLLDGKEVRR